jgi:hypothetical protein
LDRLYDPNFGGPRQRWIDKWKKLDTDFVENDRRYWMDDDPLPHQELRKTLEARTTLSFLTLDLNGPNGAGSAKDVLAAVLNAGVPVALWLRGHTGVPQLTRDQITQRLWPGSYSELPGKVFALRRCVTADGVCPQLACKGFALLWDNPDFPPPGERLQEPTKPNL